jgi:hypothetical protein
VRQLAAAFISLNNVTAKVTASLPHSINLMSEKRLPFTCPLCGRRTEYPVAIMVEGAVITCPFCKVKLNLHGHMWEEIQAVLATLKKDPDNSTA